MSFKKNQKIWIDLDNSPHVPFFRPVIRELNQKGFTVVVTARNCFQVCGLADLFEIPYKKIGRHYGKSKLLKIIGTLFRSLELLPIAIIEKPSLSISHGSRSQLITASLLRIPTAMIFDYEHASGLKFISSKWKIVSDLISIDKITLKKNYLRYPGIKENVYATGFKPNLDIRKTLGLNEKNIVVTIRPPATEAHYHNPESDKLFIAVIEFLGSNKDVRIIILPRNEIKQTRVIKERWATWCDSGKIIIPESVLNGLDLIWHSDLVVSGGGTMNREAAALGVPVYSIFRGKIGAVDQYLEKSGRLTFIETVEEVEKKIRVIPRTCSNDLNFGNRDTLNTIVNHIVTIFERS